MHGLPAAQALTAPPCANRPPNAPTPAIATPPLTHQAAFTHPPLRACRRYGRIASKPDQRQARKYPAYLFNVGQSLVREDIVAFFDGYNLAADEIR